MTILHFRVALASIYELTEQAIALANAEHLEGELANVLSMHARIYIGPGDYGRAEESAQESLRFADQKLDAHSMGTIRAHLSEVALGKGKLEEAAVTAKRALALLGERPDRFAALLHTNLAKVPIARGKHWAAPQELELVFALIHLHIRRELFRGNASRLAHRSAPPRRPAAWRGTAGRGRAIERANRRASLGDVSGAHRKSA